MGKKYCACSNFNNQQKTSTLLYTSTAATSNAAVSSAIESSPASHAPRNNRPCNVDTSGSTKFCEHNFTSCSSPTDDVYKSYITPKATCTSSITCNNGILTTKNIL